MVFKNFRGPLEKQNKIKASLKNFRNAVIFLNGECGKFEVHEAPYQNNYFFFYFI